MCRVCQLVVDMLPQRRYIARMTTQHTGNALEVVARLLAREAKMIARVGSRDDRAAALRLARFLSDHARVCDALEDGHAPTQRTT
jgi:hypothetical protein